MNYNLLLYLGLCLMIVGVFIVVAYGSSNSINSTKLNCDKMMYSDDWNLGYLRDVARICSNDG